MGILKDVTEGIEPFPLQPYQKALWDRLNQGGFKKSQMTLYSAVQHTGKSTFSQYMNTWNGVMNKPPIIRWQQLPGRKLKAYAEVGPRGFERGLRDGDMDEIQNWIWTNIPSAKRLAFDMWIFKEDKHITMFLMRWSS